MASTLASVKKDVDQIKGQRPHVPLPTTLCAFSPPAKTVGGAFDVTCHVYSQIRRNEEGKRGNGVGSIWTAGEIRNVRIVLVAPFDNSLSSFESSFFLFLFLLLQKKKKKLTSKYFIFNF
jgi:hypothetical protein